MTTKQHIWLVAYELAYRRHGDGETAIKTARAATLAFIPDAGPDEFAWSSPTVNEKAKD